MLAISIPLLPLLLFFADYKRQGVKSSVIHFFLYIGMMILLAFFTSNFALFSMFTAPFLIPLLLFVKRVRLKNQNFKEAEVID
ncbi:hypothetical protein SAMN05216474_0834 [Lishizhenia tianjinensis]|uniref:Uncharacterized protein n=1 Tax=Lishizhenia tianjinensis TaxID=477690 RepID=A0A1I6YDU9_9FLAO|nr:hypothetical protein SAMN05216474_0834 [Lishizhenia tianjinensis]